MSEKAKSENIKFTKREWVHLIITLSIAQAFIWFISYQYANNSNALGYVSFAGTLISIILAVLAIGYTYGESHQQKNSSVTLGNQIESLVSIKDKLEIQANSLNDIKDLKNALENFYTKLDNHFSETNNNLNKVKIDLELIGKSTNDSITHNNSELSTVSQRDIFLNVFLSSNKVFIDLGLIMVVLYHEDYEESKKSPIKFCESILKDDLSDILLGFIVGVFVTVLNVLEKVDLLDLNDNKIDDSVIERFKELVNSPSENLIAQSEGTGGRLISYALEKSKYLKNS